MVAIEAIAALKAFEQPKVIILGGSDKGAEFDELAQTIAERNMRGIILIGDMQPKIHAALQVAGVDEGLIRQLGTAPMSEVVETAASIAQSGDAVILSPACASFDMFANYKDRGEQFIAAVSGLR